MLRAKMIRPFRSVWLTGSFLAACGGQAFTAGQSGGSAGSEVGGAAGAAGIGTGGGGEGGGAVTDAGSDGARAGAGGGAGQARNSGDCDTMADCGGNPCVELSPGGYRVCTTPVREATQCSTPLMGSCCSSKDCTSNGPGGKCVEGPVEPACGGPFPAPANVCAKDDCKAADDCKGAFAVCIPAGAFGRKAARCATGGCRRDADCTEEPGGACLPVVSACCGQANGLYCVYKNGCRGQGDCKGDEHCDTSQGKAVCASGALACPL